MTRYAFCADRVAQATSISTTEIYTHVLTARMQALVNEHHPLARG